MDRFRRTLDTLPVELLYEIQFYALSDSLPHTCRRLYDVFKSAPPTIQAEYISGRCLLVRDNSGKNKCVTRALRYPVCTQDVLEAVLRRSDFPSISGESFELPRRIFRPLIHSPPTGGWKEQDEPLPFLQYLFSHPRLPAPDPDSHEGYPLTRAVHAGFMHLIRFMLDHGASPRWKGGLAVLVAIRQRNLRLVKVLIERGSSASRGSAKRRKIMDRIEVNQNMLRTAIKCNANDIADYLMREKGCVPDIQTLGLMK
ncbi:hypothetical protein EW146_g6188 [Bondarzewia mesenterica]|uniref:Uncharacterized protein n=1 Tax=Bondarzewia mesenterica TaxID=1095465 RepID=A0A4S4LV30_9AGAM|nr:hypothetical protein EW146_g6188 [Bondarzewia mesenterica]